MRSNYKKLGSYIQQVDIRNKDNKVNYLRGISSIYKELMPSKANIVGTDMSKYKIVQKGQFAFNPNTARMGDKIPIALNLGEPCIVSQIYPVFEIIDETKLLPEYLIMWFKRAEFDRYARSKSHGSAREIFDWEEMCAVELPIPSIEKQHEIVAEYYAITNRIKLNRQLNQKLEETAQAIYKEWFVDFEFPDENGKPYKSNGGEMVYCDELEKEVPKGWGVKLLSDLCSKIGSGSTPKGGKESYKSQGLSLVRSMNVYDYNFLYEDLAFIDDLQAKKLSSVKLQEKDILLNITGVSVARCCIVPLKILPAYVNQHVSIIRLKEEHKSLTHYLLLFITSSETKQKILGISESGSTRQAITKDDIENLKLLKPKKDVVCNFEELVSSFFTKKNLISEEIEILLRLKEILLSKMATVEG